MILLSIFIVYILYTCILYCYIHRIYRPKYSKSVIMMMTMTILVTPMQAVIRVNGDGNVSA